MVLPRNMIIAKSVKTRRRGATLEQAIIEVAWDRLVEHGYTSLTMEMVARAAHTSRSVLARRWNSKASLVLAAIKYQLSKHPPQVPDQGDVRAELLEYLQRLGSFAPIFTTINALLSNEMFRKAFATPEEVRRALSAGRTDYLSVILDRAVARNEIDPDKLTPPIKTLVRDLLRQHVMMHRAAPPEQLLVAWVDSIFLPLVRRTSP